ncbi:MAG: hypothetical protein WBM81_09540, partial [Sedimenticolaceae bacterium]
LDSNRAEQHTHSIAEGRKVWLFTREQCGAHATADRYTIVETVTANGLEAYNHLTQVVDRTALVQTAWARDECAADLERHAGADQGFFSGTETIACWISGQRIGRVPDARLQMEWFREIWYLNWYLNLRIEKGLTTL